MKNGNSPPPISTGQAIDLLQSNIEALEQAPPFRKLELANCALKNALAILRALDVRLTRVEQIELRLEKDLGN